MGERGKDNIVEKESKKVLVKTLPGKSRDSNPIQEIHYE